eukprot:CAMPEP_0174751166 /NCGR_PEP_ID=MMETSP1094-20130205/99250_1 /TAXON_ID=156173 /ORGANISM="Chrysochromulina brevifilum, Strain UTEX LB 985" /LENGTH=80 /DNA_ID=CAMNT_0015956611 /DNA_START=112 /DNA_END=355 /DNA_ORIENTATION=-
MPWQMLWQRVDTIASPAQRLPLRLHVEMDVHAAMDVHVDALLDNVVRKDNASDVAALVPHSDGRVGGGAGVGRLHRCPGA